MVENSNNFIISKNVFLDSNVVVEDYCYIGISAKDDLEKTYIGENSLIRSGTYIYSGNKIGKNFMTGNKVNIRENNIIGNDVSIGTLSVIEHHIEIEDGVRIHSQVFIPEYSKLKKNSWVGPNVVLTNSKFPNRLESKSKLKGPIISENAIIGANSTILPGIKIGKNALVGAGSVVTKDVPENCIFAGNPAVKIGSLTK